MNNVIIKPCGTLNPSDFTEEQNQALSGILDRFEIQEAKFSSECPPGEAYMMTTESDFHPTLCLFRHPDLPQVICIGYLREFNADNNLPDQCTCKFCMAN